MPVRRWRGYRSLMETARRRINWLICAGFALPFASALSSPAYAQFAGSIALSSNEMFRGETISANDPALSLSLSLDNESGLFAGVAASIAAGNSDPRMTYASQYAGYAKRFGETSVEAGIIHRTYERVVDTEYRRDFAEIYAGVTHKSLKARLYVSPNYRRDNRTSYYGEINARLLGVGEWSLDGHAGLSVLPGDKGSGTSPKMRTYRDWRLQVSRPVGKLFLSGGVAATNYPVYSPSGKARIFASASYAF
jgi:uncharacterized protein (TIGR02001 family)